MNQALYRKWRPATWGEVVGQQHIVQTLQNAVSADRVAHAYLFAGPRGTGKTTTARLLAKAVNCLDPDLSNRPCDKCAHCKALNQGRFLDLIEIDAASNTSVDDVRDLRDKINFSPNQGRFKVYIVDEVHMLSTAAFNALLKTLEEPPPHAMFILATTEEHKIPATVLSRCQRHEFRRIPAIEIAGHLRVMVDAEEITAEDDALKLVARQATGSMRDAISLLDQLASTGENIALSMAQNVLGTATSQVVIDLMDAVLAEKTDEALNLIHSTLDGGTDPRQFARQIVEYLRQLLLIRVGSLSSEDAAPETRVRMAKQAQSFSSEDLLGHIRIFTPAANEAQTTWQPALPLEMAVVESLIPIKGRGVQHSSNPESAPVSQREKPSNRKRVTNPPKEGASPKGFAPSTSDPSDSGIHKKWKGILSDVRKHSLSTEALLKSGKVVEFKNRRLTLGFASDILKKQMERDDHLKALEKVIATAMGHEVEIRCVIFSDSRQTLPPEVDSDGMVATAIRLGGEIVDAREIRDSKKQ